VYVTLFRCILQKLNYMQIWGEERITMNFKEKQRLEWLPGELERITEWKVDIIDK